MHCGGRCAVGSGGKSVGYLAHGTATDYMYDVAGVPMSFTWEIFGDLNADFVDCFRMFNPIDKVTVESTISNWASAVLSLVELLPIHPDIAALNLEPVTTVPGTASNATALTTPRMTTDSEQQSNATKSKGSEEQQKPDSAVHGGRNDAALQHTGNLDHPGSELGDLDESLHENVLGGHSFYASEMPAILRWLYILPVIILVLLVLLLKKARTERTPWLRMRQRMV